MSGTDEKYIVPGLKRGLEMLQAFSSECPELSISDLARAVNVSRSSAFRIVHTLEHGGFLEKSAVTKRYRLGYRILDLGYGFVSGLDIVERATPLLKALQAEADISTHLTVLDGTDILYLATFNANTRFSSNVRVGTRFPAYATNAGRILMCETDTSELQALFEGVEFKPYSDETVRNLEELIALLKQDRKAGFALSWGYFQEGVASIAAPIRTHGGEIIASVSVSCPTSFMDRNVFQSTVKQAVIRCSEDISTAMGNDGQVQAVA